MPANPQIAIARYAELASIYDATCKRMDPIRKRTIDSLDLRRGDVVFDIACGTGKSFQLLEERIGPNGLIVGIEQSPEMIAIARKRVAAGGWNNIVLLQGDAEKVQFPCLADALLFNYTHDVLQSRRAVAHIFEHTRPGARVAASGTKFFPWWLWPLNLFVIARSWRYLTTFEGIHRPYRHLTPYLAGWKVETTFGGMGYIGHGVHPGAPRFGVALVPAFA